MCRSAHVGWCGRETYDESACQSPIQLAICQLIYTATHTILSHPIVSNPMPVSPNVVACGSLSHHQLHLRPLQQRRWGHLVLTKQTGHRQLQSPHHRGGQEAARRSTLYRLTQLGSQDCCHQGDCAQHLQTSIQSAYPLLEHKARRSHSRIK